MKMTERLPEDLKWAFSARRIPLAAAYGHDSQPTGAIAGDLILGRVAELGQHPRIQLASGRHAALNTGDLIVMPCGARYAADQFEGIAQIDAGGCDMLAGGGCLGRMRWRHDRMRMPTRILPLGRVTGAAGQVLNTADFALPDPMRPEPALPVIAVIGTSMNSGKTTATVALARGLTLAGWKTAAVKATGTGSFGDFHSYADTGACYVGDFTDAGMVSTYLEPTARIRAGISRLSAAASRAGAQIMVMEIADGILQRETAALLADGGFRAGISGMIFACGDAVAAVGGVAQLGRHGIRPLRITGLLSCSPLAAAEAAEATGIEIASRQQLTDPAEASALLAEAGITAGMAA